MFTWGLAARPWAPEEQRTNRSGTDPDSEDPPNPVETSKQALCLSAFAYDLCLYSTVLYWIHISIIGLFHCCQGAQLVSLDGGVIPFNLGSEVKMWHNLVLQTALVQIKVDESVEQKVYY